MSTLLLTDPLFLEHDPGAGNPERPARLSSILALLERVPLPSLVERRPRSAHREEVLRVHTPALVDELEATRGHRVQLDMDTATSAHSWEAALRAAGAAVEATEAVLRGEVDNAFALVRPPGHHAEPDRAMGFCLLNNVAIAAEAARAAGAERVLVLDWDVHHGNGTQAAFWNRRDVLYQSLHQAPLYPGTGSAHEVGVGEGAGFTVNCPLPPGRTDSDYRAVFEELLLPVAQAWRPEVVLVSAGFDCHADDPLGGMRVTERGFAAMAQAVKALAQEVCGGRLVLLLEGGYSLYGTASSVHACLQILTGGRDSFPAGEVAPDTVRALKESRAALRPYWPLL